MNTTVTTHSEGEVARPLRVLVPLIKEDFEAAETVGMPYYRAAGEKLLEARDGSFEGRVTEFYSWADRTFGKKKTQIQNYISLVTHKTKSTAAGEPTSLKDHLRRVGRDIPTSGGGIRPPSWQKDIKENIERARREAERIREENLTRQQEREAEQKLAMRLIDIGYKVLAKELHPDKGGSRDAMQRLGRVRDRLKQCI